MHLHGVVTAAAFMLSSILITQVVAQDDCSNVITWAEFSGNLEINVFTPLSNRTPAEVLGVPAKDFNATLFEELALEAILTVIVNLLAYNENELIDCPTDTVRAPYEIDCKYSPTPSNVTAMVSLDYAEDTSATVDISEATDFTDKLESAIAELVAMMVANNTAVGCANLYDVTKGETMYELAIIISSNHTIGIPKVVVEIADTILVTDSLSAIWANCRFSDVRFDCFYSVFCYKPMY